MTPIRDTSTRTNPSRARRGLSAPKSPLERLSDGFKDLMRTVPHALTIISSIPKGGSPAKGLLVSSYNSVTVSPIPYVSFNIKLPSSTLDAIGASGCFTASVIDDPYTADVFAQINGKDEKLCEAMLEDDGRLKEGYGGLVWMKCVWESHRRIDVGDHAIIIGEVLDVGRYPGTGLQGESAMVYWLGGYNEVDNKVGRTEPGTKKMTRKEGEKPIWRYVHELYEYDEGGLVRKINYDVDRIISSSKLRARSGLRSEDPRYGNTEGKDGGFT